MKKKGFRRYTLVVGIVATDASTGIAFTTQTGNMKNFMEVGQFRSKRLTGGSTRLSFVVREVRVSP